MPFPPGQLHEGQVLKGESGKSYLLVSSLGQSNVWTAVDASTQSEIYIVKQPAPHDEAWNGWPKFQHEMIMHEYFKDSPSIRGQVDRVPPTPGADPPRVILEILESTLWACRAKRSFTDAEVKKVMKDALVALRDVHAKGLVYAGTVPSTRYCSSSLTLL